MRGTRARAKAERKRFGIIPAYAGNTTNDYDFDTPRRDHPRVCGEHPSYMSRGRYEVGSSPRMRGTLTILSRPNDLIGIIPAYAGNTERHYQRRVAGRDHPRVCGEHWCFWNPRIALWGSSPRMRGTHLLHLLPFPEEGIIPAYAGNTSTPSETPLAHRDHPRVCGEHPRYFLGVTEDMGSSPRMRGTPLRCRPCMRRTGIIPAYAGNTIFRSTRHLDCRDHPRVCGEHSRSSSMRAKRGGSSPRMRGTLSVGRAVCRGFGIIPAYAGNTTAENAADHDLLGSSPRMRGTPPVGHPRCRTMGIIPAYAGNTRRWWNARSPTRDHPRVCGEHLRTLLSTCVALGSSPRMRGTRARRGERRILRGIIPAYAGNTSSRTANGGHQRDHPRVCGEHYERLRFRYPP